MKSVLIRHYLRVVAPAYSENQIIIVFRKCTIMVI